MSTFAVEHAEGKTAASVTPWPRCATSASAPWKPSVKARAQGRTVQEPHGFRQPPRRRRVINKRLLENLVRKSGAFDSIHPNRAQLFEGHRKRACATRSRSRASDRVSKQVSLFGADDKANTAMKLSLPNASRTGGPWKRLSPTSSMPSAFYLSAHPLDAYAGTLAGFAGGESQGPLATLTAQDVARTSIENGRYRRLQARACRQARQQIRLRRAVGRHRHIRSHDVLRRSCRRRASFWIPARRCCSPSTRQLEEEKAAPAGQPRRLPWKRPWRPGVRNLKTQGSTPELPVAMSCAI